MLQADNELLIRDNAKRVAYIQDSIRHGVKYDPTILLKLRSFSELFMEEAFFMTPQQINDGQQVISRMLDFLEMNSIIPNE